MYFNVEPKTKKKDLFGVEYSLNSLMDCLSDNSTRMMVIKGLRRMGKTSLLNVALNESKMDFVKVDVRGSPCYDKQEFFKFLINEIRQTIGESLINKIIKNISGLKVGYKDFSATIFLSKEENLITFFERFDKQLRKENKRFILAFDEIQLLKEIGFDYFLASVFDNYKNIKILITGSEVGLVDKFLGKEDYEAPLYGRASMEFKLKRMKKEKTMEFLNKGFKQIHKKISFEEINEVIENLDGIIGWVTYYGWFRYKGKSHKEAIEKIREEGKGIARKELMQFLERRKAKEKYLKILKYIAKGNNSWKMLKYNFEKEGIKIADSQLNLYLKELIDYAFIEKTEGKYIIGDPLLFIVTHTVL